MRNSTVGFDRRKRLGQQPAYENYTAVVMKNAVAGNVYTDPEEPIQLGDQIRIGLHPGKVTGIFCLEAKKRRTAITKK